MKSLIETCSLVALVLVAAQAQLCTAASVIMYDGVPVSGTGAYLVDGSITGESPDHASMVGFTAANTWANVATSTFQALATGLDHSLLATELGGSILGDHTVNLNPGRSNWRTFTSAGAYHPEQFYRGLMQYEAGIPTDTSMQAFTQISETESDVNGTDVFGAGNEGGVRWGFEGNGAGGVDAFVEFRDGVASTSREVLAMNITADTPHLFVVKIESGAGGGDTMDTISAWFNPPSIVTEASLGSPDFTGSAFTIDDNQAMYLDTLSLAFEGTGISNQVLFDEFRIGTDFFTALDVEEPPPVPEPSSFLLLGLGTLGLLRHKRRRKRETFGFQSSIQPANSNHSTLA